MLAFITGFLLLMRPQIFECEKPISRFDWQIGIRHCEINELNWAKKENAPRKNSLAPLFLVPVRAKDTSFSRKNSTMNQFPPKWIAIHCKPLIQDYIFRKHNWHAHFFGMLCGFFRCVIPAESKFFLKSAAAAWAKVTWPSFVSLKKCFGKNSACLRWPFSEYPTSQRVLFLFHETPVVFPAAESAAWYS